MPALQFASAPFLIAGPCVVESDELNLKVGAALAELSRRLDLPIIYKASYDKANRSRLQAARGPGIEAGLRALQRARRAPGLPLLTDGHGPSQVSAPAPPAPPPPIPPSL